MAHKKRRVFQHIMEDQSLTLLRNVLPEEWVIRQYSPDYGIDIVVEVFKYIDENREKADALGELFFAQVKSVKSTVIKRIKVYSRGNVEKLDLRENLKEYLEIDVIKFKIDTDELLTVQSMGAGVPVLLFLVSLDLKRVFFVCLNDLIDKIIIPSDPNYTDKQNKSICIPVKNEVKNEYVNLVHLRFYAKRSKFYSAFLKFEYQNNELNYLSVGLPEGSWEGSTINFTKQQIKHFVRVLKRLDIWHDSEMWGLIEIYYKIILELESVIENPEVETLRILFYYKGFLWERLNSLSHVYEEICREWCLPTYLAQLLSYPEYPEGWP